MDGVDRPRRSTRTLCVFAEKERRQASERPADGGWAVVVSYGKDRKGTTMAETMAWNERLRALEARLWESADALRSNSKLTSSQYCMPVMGLIFLRYAWGRFRRQTEKLEQKRKNNPNSRSRDIDDIEKADYTGNGVLWLPEAARYDRLAALPGDENLAEALNAAMAAIEAESTDLAGVLPKQYGELPPAILADLVRTFNDPVLDTIGGDVFGRIYEYFLQKFAPQEHFYALQARRYLESVA